MQQPQIMDVTEIEQHFFSRGDPFKKLLKITLKLLDARQVGILYGTDISKRKFLPTDEWDRGIADRFDGRGLKGQILKYVGKSLVTRKNLSPVFFFKKKIDGTSVDSDGMISYILRTCTSYYRQGISILFCPDISTAIYQMDDHYAVLPFYSYNGRNISEPDIQVKVDLNIIKHFKARNYVSIYIPDYGILVVNSADPALFETVHSTSVREDELVRKFDDLIQLVEIASLAALGQLKGDQGAKLLWRKEYQLRTTSRELIENERNYRDLYENAPIAYFSLDGRGRITKCNNNTVSLSGYSKEELSGRSIFKFLGLESKKRKKLVESIQGMVLAGQPVRDVEMAFTRKDDQEVWVSLSLDTLRDADEKIVEIRAMSSDISSRKKLEKQLLQAQKMEAIGTLAGGIAHDFNNILSPIAGYSEMLLMDMDDNDPKKKAQLKIIYDCAQYAKTLVNQMLTFSRQKEGEYKLLKPHVFVDDALNLTKSFLPPNIQIKENINQECGLLMVDPVQIHQVMMNLISNAYHAMEPAGGILEVGLDRVKINSGDMMFPLKPGHYIVLRVGDTGTGILPEVQDRIFEPFFTTKQEGKGSGIGLSVVHGIVQSHNGYINVDSTPGQGSRFEIYLPASSESRLPDAESDGDEPLREGSERILLVDDDKKVAFMQQHMLEKLGYRVFCFLGSLQALEVFKNAPDQVDLVITDLTMPDMTGFELCTRICDIRPDIPVILCTGFGEHINRTKYHHHGIKGFLNKPVAVKDLSVLIRKILDTKDDDA